MRRIELLSNVSARFRVSGGLERGTEAPLSLVIMDELLKSESEAVLSAELYFPVRGVILELEFVLDLSITGKAIGDFHRGADFHSQKVIAVIGRVRKLDTRTSLDIRLEVTNFPIVSYANLVGLGLEILVSARKFVLGLYIGASNGRCRQAN